MSIGDVLARGIPILRQQAESMMRDEWVVYRVGIEWSDEAGGDVESTTTVYDGPGKLQSFEPYESKPQAGAHQFIEIRQHLHLPVGTSGDVAIGDRAVRTACPYNPDLVGTEVRIEAAPSGHKTSATANRFPVTEGLG